MPLFWHSLCTYFTENYILAPLIFHLPIYECYQVNYEEEGLEKANEVMDLHISPGILHNVKKIFGKWASKINLEVIQNVFTLLQGNSLLCALKASYDVICLSPEV
jgi:hypothetical protein